MKKQIFITLTFSFLLAAFISSIQFASAQDIPTLTPYVTDLAGVIDPSYENQINSYATQLESATTSEIVVLTVSSVQPMSIEEYAVSVFEKNGIGQKGEDNGVLIVVAIEDREWKIEVGYGLEGDINDAKAGRIGRTYMTQHFREERYGEGLYLTVKTLGDIIAGDKELSAQFDQTSEFGEEDTFIFIIIMFFILVSIIIPIIYMIKERRCPKCKSWMRVEYKGDKICYVCDKCGYKKCKKRKRGHFLFFVGGSGGGRGGGFSGGGFGGGGSGGGGASGGW